MEQEDNKRKKLLNSTTRLINTATTRDQLCGTADKVLRSFLVAQGYQPVTPHPCR